MRRGWTYFVVTLALWAFVPELRRLIDWRIGFQAINLLAVLPLAALIPLGVAALRSWPAVPPVMRIVAWLWLGGFVYAFVVALTSGGAAAAAYTFAEFVLPLWAGLWASTSPNPAQAFRRLSVAVLAFAAIASLYGIVQYVAIPPWDAYWMQNADIGSAGKPLAFQVRVFGTLNAPGPFADFAMVALILAIGALGVSSLRVMAQISVTVIALALSLVRSAWLALAVGVVTFVCLSPRPLRALAALAATAAVGAAVVVSLPTIIGADRVNDDLSHRLSTLTDVGSDESANDRELQVRNA
ncbi:MAG: hypothetical protein JWO66_1083, partial [Candidatus Eremiobacteraeota bacterium]|nr:hypothetical protein [Candidatus Eremiobacteraeota bacterium]